MRHFATLLLVLSALGTAAQTDSTVYILHKFQQAIGRETAYETRGDSGLRYDVHFKFVDRGSAVPLEAHIQTGPEFSPRSFTIKGKTSRFSRIDDSVALVGDAAYIRVNDSVVVQKVQPEVFTVAGYSPVTAQMLLLRYWMRRGRPAVVGLLPGGRVHIWKDGTDTIGQIALDRYVVSGLVWGNEFVWAKGDQLVALITNDAEGDKLEAMLAEDEQMLPQLLERAAVAGMRIFTAAKKPYVHHDRLAIVGGSLVDVVSGRMISHATVLIDHGIIRAAGPADSVRVPAGTYVVHAEGKTILPGLWDMHAHFEQAEWGPAYLAAGVTSVRDCGNEFTYINTIQKTIDDGQGVGPHIYKAGIIDGKGPYALGIIQASTPEEGVREVDRYKANGFVQIKIYSSVRPEVVKAICAEAHRLHLSVTGHIPNGMTLIQGVDSGMDMVNHIQYVDDVIKKDSAYRINPLDSHNIAVVRFMREHDVVLDPTLGVFELAFRSLDDSITTIEPAFSTLPLQLQPLFLNTGEPAPRARILARIMRNYKTEVKLLYDAGLPIVAGTDMDMPGYSLYRELELYVSAGLTPLEAIQCATITPARVLHVDKGEGSVSQGKVADLILVDGDPLSDIRDVRRVSTVIHLGNIYDPVALHRLAGFNIPEQQP